MSLNVLSRRREVEARRQREFEAYHAYERQRLHDDELTWAAEVLDGPVTVELDFALRDSDLYAADGGNLRDVFENAIAHDREAAASNPGYVFQLKRSEAELDEYEHMVRMAKGEAPNVMIVVSPLPSEMRGREGCTYGYQPKRGLGFFRVITHEGGGRIKMMVQSFDKSDPVAINAMYARYGTAPDWSRDLIDQRIHLDVGDSAERELIPDTLLFLYDQSMHARYGGDWYAGRTSRDRRNAYEFAKSQQDLLEEHTKRMSRKGLSEAQKEAYRRDYAAALRRRHEGRRVQSESGVSGEMSAAGSMAAASGEAFDGCGLSVGGRTTAEGQLAAAGYSNRLWVSGECRVCLRAGRVGECAVCMNCEEADNNGQDLTRIHARAKAAKERADKLSSMGSERLQSTKKTISRNARPPVQTIQTADGRTLYLQHKIVIGGTAPVWVDERGREAARQ